MHSFQTTAILAFCLTAQTQITPPLILSSRDIVDGPLGRAPRVENLQVFADGRVVYIEADATNNRGKNTAKSVYKSKIESRVVQRLEHLLDNSELRALPKQLSSTVNPIDFFWRKSLTIPRADGTQEINIENFYPFANLREVVYPKALLELECSLQDIKLAAARRPKEEANWCKALVASRAAESVSVPPAGDCKQDPTKPKIIAGQGWGPIRVGAPIKDIDRSLGKGTRGNAYKDVYFRQYAPKGIEISFNSSDDTIHAIFFYNGQCNDEEIGTFCGQTGNGIGWLSSVEDVQKAYGKPIAEFSGNVLGGSWRRLVFAGIDFRFENGKMVRIGIPGN